MPSYEILVEGKPRKVELTKTGQDSFTAKIDGEPRRIELKAKTLSLEKPLTIKVQGKAYTIQASKIEEGRIVPVKVDAATFKIAWKNPFRKSSVATSAPSFSNQVRRSSGARQISAAAGAVTAPMTGKIVSVKVKKGDTVRKDQVLCIIEAMKMENEISASQAGTVKEVSIAEGSPVSEGDTLFIIG